VVTKWPRNGHGRRRTAAICKRIANIGASDERQPVDVGTDRIEHSKVEMPAGMGVTSVDQDDKLASEPRVNLARVLVSADQQRKSDDDCRHRHQEEDGGHPPLPIPPIAPARRYHNREPFLPLGREDPGHRKGGRSRVLGASSRWCCITTSTPALRDRQRKLNES
jgi:hypothetical protein